MFPPFPSQVVNRAGHHCRYSTADDVYDAARRAAQRPQRVAAFVGAFFLLAGCNSWLIAGVAEEAVPEQCIEWECPGKGWIAGGVGAESIWQASFDPTRVDIWQWGDASVKKQFHVGHDHVSSLGILPHGKWVSLPYDAKTPTQYFCLGSVTSGKVIERWSDKDLDLSIASIGQGSLNGKYLTIWSTHGFEPRMVRFGFISSNGKSLDWIVTIPWEKDSMPQASIHQVVPSNDGVYIAVARFHFGVAMIDVSNKKIAWVASSVAPEEGSEESWKRIPLDENNPTRIVFRPDSKVVYVGGTTEAIIGLNVDTGKVVSRWKMPTLPNLERRPITYTPLIQSLSASADGRFVAAGTTPDGLVFLFTTNNGQCQVLKHSGPKRANVSLLSFSPDSKRLATEAAGQIKIWKLPEEKAESKAR
jgi:WD40 repeat protein